MRFPTFQLLRFRSQDWTKSELRLVLAEIGGGHLPAEYVAFNPQLSCGSVHAVSTGNATGPISPRHSVEVQDAKAQCPLIFGARCEKSGMIWTSQVAIWQCGTAPAPVNPMAS